MNTIKNAAIGAMIKAAYAANGGDIEAAFDSVIGQGAYKKMAHEVYHALRAKQGL